MVRLFSPVFIMVLVLSFSAGSFAQDVEQVEVEKTKTGIKVSGAVVMTATVEALNVNERLVVLRGETGRVQVVEAGPEVKNFDQIEIGDQVKVEFYESVALSLGKPGDKPGETAANVAITAPRGEKPGMLNVDVVDVIATVEAIDKPNREVTLMSPEGRSVTVNAPKGLGDLEQIKVGDKIHARYTEALAVSVQKP